MQFEIPSFSIPPNGPSPKYDIDQKTRKNAFLQEIPGWSRLHRPQRHPRDEHNCPPIRRRSQLRHASQDFHGLEILLLRRRQPSNHRLCEQ